MTFHKSDIGWGNIIKIEMTEYLQDVLDLIFDIFGDWIFEVPGHQGSRQKCNPCQQTEPGTDLKHVSLSDLMVCNYHHQQFSLCYLYFGEVF